jgi:hypothetical protein
VVRVIDVVDPGLRACVFRRRGAAMPRAAGAWMLALATWVATAAAQPTDSLSAGRLPAADSSAVRGPRLEVRRVLPLGYPEFIEPSAIACGPLGQLYVADLGRGSVARLDTLGSTLFAFETPAGQPDLQPLDLAVTGFKVYVLDAVSSALLRYDEDGAYLDVLQSFREEGVETPRAVSVDGTGRILLVNEARHGVRVIDETQRNETLVGGFGVRSGELSRPSGGAFAQEGSFYVADTGNARVLYYSGVGNLLRTWVAGIREPRGLVVGRRGEVYVADAEARAVHVVSLDAEHTRLLLPDHEPIDVCACGDDVWILCLDPPALVRARVVREN